MRDFMKLVCTYGSQERGQDVEAELVGLLYKQVPVALIATLLATAVPICVLWPVISHLTLLMWACGVNSIGLMGLGLFWKYPHGASTYDDISRWRTSFLILTTFSGAAWGSAAVFLFPVESVPHQVFLTFLLSGMSAGAAVTLASVLVAFPLFILPAILPLCTQLFIQGGSIAIAMGLLSLAFVGVMLVVAFHLHTSLADTFALRIENLDLMRDLSFAKEQTESANQQLVGSNNTLSEAMHEAMLSAERFRSLCASSPIGIFQTDVTGSSVYFNPRGLEIIGRPLEDCLGFRWMKSVVREDRDEIRARWKADFEAGNEFSHEFRLVRAPGTGRWVHVRAAPMQTENGALIGYVGTMEDITERRSVERMKNEFVSVVSHELRTPLTSIRGALGLVASKLLGELSEKGQRMLEIAISNTDRLVRLINDILDIERLESGKVTIQKQACDATTVLTQAVDVMSAMAEKAGVTLSVYPQPLRLWADPDRIIQTLTNLVSNAIKFSPPGGTVWLTAERNGEHVLFRVLDQGRGIPAEKLESVFERFEQIDTSDARDKGGSGLGLAICRSIVQQHDGRIWAESTIDQGSSFCFTLPALREQSPEILTLPDMNQPAVNVKEPSERCHILVAESDRDLARVLITLFERHGVVTYAQTGLEAMECIQLVTPQLIVLDPALPEKDGFSVVDWLRQSTTLQQMALAVYSASDLDEEERQKLELGPTLFCTKGRVTPNELEQRVISWFEQIRQVKDTSDTHNENTPYERRTAHGNEQMPAYY